MQKNPRPHAGCGVRVRGPPETQRHLEYKRKHFPLDKLAALQEQHHLFKCQRLSKASRCNGTWRRKEMENPPASPGIVAPGEGVAEQVFAGSCPGQVLVASGEPPREQNYKAES